MDSSPWHSVWWPAVAVWISLVSLATVSCATTERSHGELGGTLRVVIQTPSQDQVFHVEVADSPAERELGLMHRTALAPRGGMLFLFPTEQHLRFWMKETLIPLDMIFIDASRTIVGIVESAEPLTTDSRSVAASSQFVLELIGGSAKEFALRPGQRVDFEARVPTE